MSNVFPYLIFLMHVMSIQCNLSAATVPENFVLFMSLILFSSISNLFRLQRVPAYSRIMLVCIVGISKS